jgi:large subunit ribosomal protein L5|tara:strand:+ start:204 stop:707 length:504 start_codon:yes stop_codon:yes gene_type:complete
MREIKIEKLTLNIGAGKDQVKLEKGMKLLKNITGLNPVKTFTMKRIPEWGIRPGLPIGCKITLRKGKSMEMVKKLLAAKEKRLKESQFDNNGNIAFGIHECIDIPDFKYDPDIGIMGLEVCLTLERPGFRIKKRKIKRRKIPIKHRITKEEAIDYMKKNFDIKMGDE